MQRSGAPALADPISGVDEERSFLTEGNSSSHVSRSKWEQLGVMPAKASIQTWPHVLRLWIPAYAGMTA
jgi:hypothetical protein